MNTILTFYIKTMSSQGLWPLVAIWPEHLDEKQYEDYLRANDIYVAIQREVQNMTWTEARTFWANHVPRTHPFPSFLFVTEIQ